MSRSSFHSERDISAAYDAHADAIFRHCYLRTFDREQGKELMLQTFRKAWQFIAEGNYIDDMKMFLYRTASSLIAEVRPQMAEVTVAAENEDRVISVLRRLESGDRDAFILRHVDGLAERDAADLLGESVEVLLQRMERCMSRISASTTHA